MVTFCNWIRNDCLGTMTFSYSKLRSYIFPLLSSFSDTHSFLLYLIFCEILNKKKKDLVLSYYLILLLKSRFSFICIWFYKINIIIMSIFFKLPIFTKKDVKLISWTPILLAKFSFSPGSSDSIWFSTFRVRGC